MCLPENPDLGFLEAEEEKAPENRSYLEISAKVACRMTIPFGYASKDWSNECFT